MKSLKITLLLAVLFACFTSCVEQDLNEDDLLVAEKEMEMPATGGNSQD